MSVAADFTSPTIAGHPFVVQDHAGDMVSLRIALGRSLSFARRLVQFYGAINLLLQCLKIVGWNLLC